LKDPGVEFVWLTAAQDDFVRLVEPQPAEGDEAAAAAPAASAAALRSASEACLDDWT